MEACGAVVSLCPGNLSLSPPWHDCEGLGWPRRGRGFLFQPWRTCTAKKKKKKCAGSAGGGSDPS